MSQKIIADKKWKSELDQTTYKYHKITLWVGVVFNLLFFVTDYINLNTFWQEFLTFRSVVSLVCLIVVLFHEKLKIPIQVMGVIPVLLISIQNAYMWSLMDVEHIQKHTMAYMTLFIGSGMFVFYHVYYSIFIVGISLVANVIFFYLNSSLTLDEVLVNGGLLTLSVAVFSILLIRMRFRLTKKELVARFALEESRHELIEKNTEIVDSINYAKRIQDALIPPIEVFKKILPNSFVLFKPKDIVSGDFYWISELDTTRKDGLENEKLVVFSVSDCTGHGVPGAFMSLIGLKILNQSVKRKGVNSPSEALDYLNSEVYKTINKHSDSESIIRDGMDVALCAINFSSLMLTFSGAKNPVYIVRNKELHEIKGDKQPIGSEESQVPFVNHQYQLETGDVVYIFSDGFADQFGGPKGKKLKYRPFKEMLIENSDKPMEEQNEKLDELFENWKGNLEQLDDVCVIGVRV
ncbi:SpoIIE family protein phosphatase [Vicingaceae bacterium]|nr:SpoIIE family protein phosphatase [Vicingaceae bacterium]